MNPALVLNQIPSLPDADVVVVGAGSAGCCAAIAAAENGAGRVVLIERYGFLGGSSTGVLDTFYGFFTPGPTPRKVVGGIPDRVVSALDADGGITLRANTYGAGTGVTYNPELLKLVWDQMVAAAGVEVIHHALLVDVVMDSSGQITEIVCASKSGFFRIKARRFIDTSGDADLCHLAGIPYEKAGDLEPAQTLTTTFRMANVDQARYKSENGKQVLVEKMAMAKELPRKKGSAHDMTIGGCIATVAVRVAGIDPTNIFELSKAEAEGRRQAFVYERFFRENIPGYENARIIGLATGIGVRETRRVYGEYRLTREDCLGLARFEDKVLLCGAPIEDHRMGADGEEETAWAYMPGNEAYDVPYRTLVPKSRDEVWVAGRCFSATHDAHASCRSMGQTMAMGQAVGVAAALSLAKDQSAREISAAVQDRLVEMGSILTLPDKIAATAADAWKQNLTTETTL